MLGDCMALGIPSAALILGAFNLEASYILVTIFGSCQWMESLWPNSLPG